MVFQIVKLWKRDGERSGGVRCRNDSALMSCRNLTEKFTLNIIGKGTLRKVILSIEKEILFRIEEVRTGFHTGCVSVDLANGAPV